MQPSVQESVATGLHQLDGYAAASDVSANDHLGNYAAPCRAFHLNIADCYLLVKLDGEETGIKSWYCQGMDYPRAAINIQKYSGANPVALAAGDVTLVY